MGSKACNPIRVARRRLHLTRERLGEILGVSGRSVSYWESGRKRPARKYGPKLKEVLGLTDCEVWRSLNYVRRKTVLVKTERKALW